MKLKAALITGASSGIGWELALLACEDYSDLILVARREDRLQKLAGEISKISQAKVHILPKDLSKNSAPQEIFQQVQAWDLQVATLVNNAGYANYGNFYETELDFEMDMIGVNISALTQLTKLFLQDMVAEGSGQILNVASTVAFQPGPFMAVYYATKAYVLSFSEALASELKDKGIQVTTLCPGPTKTEFQKVAHMDGGNLFKVFHVMDAPEVAKAGYEGMKNRKNLVVPGLLNKLTIQSNRISPRSWVTWFVRQIQAKRE